MGTRPSLDNYSFEDLIELFTEPHVFLRELVQNAIDAQVEAASSKAIEVSTEFAPCEAEAGLPDDPEDGIFTLHVIDHKKGSLQYHLPPLRV